MNNLAYDWIDAVDNMLAPHLHKIPYGNLRVEYSRWQGEDGAVVNAAIVYEVPGGSTNQINVTYFDCSGTFSYIALDTHDECRGACMDELLCMIEHAVARIPDIRRARLLEDIDRWAGMGMGQRELLQKINDLLKIEDLRGGTITMHEMKAGIAHIMAHYRTPASA